MNEQWGNAEDGVTDVAGTRRVRGHFFAWSDAVATWSDAVALWSSGPEPNFGDQLGSPLDSAEDRWGIDGNVQWSEGR